MFRHTMDKLFRGLKCAEGEKGRAIEWGEIVKNSFVLWHTAEEKDKTNVVKRYYDYNVGQGLY